MTESGGTEHRHKCGFDYEGLPVGYYDHAIRKDRGVQSKWHRIEFEEVRARIAGARPLLDVGCGPGTFLGTIEPPGRVLGLDVATNQLAYALGEYAAPHRDFVAFDGAAIPVPDSSFAAVTMIQVVEHLDDPTVLLAEAHRVLRPGGRIVVTTPNYASHWPVLEWLVGRLSPVDYAHQHITYFRPQSLEDTLGGAGFEQVETSPFMRMAPFAACLSWRLAGWMAACERKLRLVPGALLIGTGIKPG